MKRDFNADPAGHRPKGLISGLDRCGECDAPLSDGDVRCPECAALVTANEPKMGERFETKAGGS